MFERILQFILRQFPANDGAKYHIDIAEAKRARRRQRNIANMKSMEDKA